jgi:hypothetical protein
MMSSGALKVFSRPGAHFGFCDVSFAPVLSDSRDFDAYRARTGPGREN